MKACAFCAEQIQDAAVKCRFCGEAQPGGQAAGGMPMAAAVVPGQGAASPVGAGVVMLPWAPPGRWSTSFCPHCAAQFTMAPTTQMRQQRRGGENKTKCQRCHKEIIARFEDPPAGGEPPMMKPCNTCKRQIVATSLKCPHCGTQNPTTGMGVKIAAGVVVGLLFLAGLGALAGGSGSSSPAPSAAAVRPAGANSVTTSTSTAEVAREDPPEPPPIAIDANKLWRQYDSNEVAADGMYRGKKLLVSGVVDSIDKDFLDNIVVVLRSPNEFMGTHATLAKGQAGSAAQLSKGDRVRLTCTCRGRIVGSPSLDGCSF